MSDTGVAVPYPSYGDGPQASPEHRSLLDIKASLDVHFGRLQKSMDAHTRAMQALAKSAVQPVFYRRTNTVIVNNTGNGNNGIVPLGGPDQGHFWHVKSLQVFRQDLGTDTANAVYLIVSATDYRFLGNNTPTVAGASDIQDLMFNNIPFVSRYGDGEVIARFNEELFVFISTTTAAQKFVVSTSVIDYEESAAKQEWAM